MTGANWRNNWVTQGLGRSIFSYCKVSTHVSSYKIWKFMHIRPAYHGQAGEIGRAPQSFKGRVKWEQTPTKMEIDLHIEKKEDKHVPGQKRDNEAGGSAKHKERVNGRTGRQV